MGKKNRGIRANWTEEMMEEALQLLRSGRSQEWVEQQSGIPRRTLRNHLKSGSSKRSLGAKSILNMEQETDLERKILRFSRRGFPLTSKVLRRTVFNFCEKMGVKHKFNREKKLAGKEWYRAFLRRHPRIAQRKAQQLNPARAQKLNHFIVNDYFDKLDALLCRTGLKHSPEKIYNMDEKGCRLTLHHQQLVLAQKGVKRVHLVAPEHAENVTVVACANALGHVIPPMILFKGQRGKPCYSDGLPAGSAVHMTAKGSMTTEIFIKWLEHFSKFMSSSPAILIFDGASSHLDESIAEKAETLGIELLCLPSNTTHELQPMDKSVFRSFESHWDQQLLEYWSQHPDRRLSKERFSDVFTPVWGKCMTINNICNGFRSTGIYPFNRNAIPEHAFAPSLPTHRGQNIAAENNEESAIVREELWDSEDDIPLATLFKTTKDNSTAHCSTSSADQTQSADLAEKGETSHQNSFSEVLVTPDMAPIKTPNRKKALNYRAQEVKRHIFKDRSSGKKVTNISKKGSVVKRKSADTRTTSLSAAKEVWMCSVCLLDFVAAMRACSSCGTWVHEECVGLTVEDKEAFICPECMP